MGFFKNKKTLSNQRIFYIRVGKKDVNGVFKHIPFFKGKIFDKNVWIDEMLINDIVKEVEEIKNEEHRYKINQYNTSSIINFNWQSGNTYSVISGDLVNTHIDWFVRDKEHKYNVRTYIKLNKSELSELKEMFGELPPYKRDPFQFGLLLATGFGVLSTAVFMFIQTFQSNSLQIEQYKQHRELLELIKKKDIQIENLIENTIVLDKDSVKSKS